MKRLKAELHIYPIMTGDPVFLKVKAKSKLLIVNDALQNDWSRSKLH
jgi:hypothetical protein